MNEWEWHALEDKAPLKSLEFRGIPIQSGDRVRLQSQVPAAIFSILRSGKNRHGRIRRAGLRRQRPRLRRRGRRSRQGHRTDAPAGPPFFLFSRRDRDSWPRAKTRPSTKTKSILIAGIGNIFLADDGFGVEVAARLADHAVSVRREGRRFWNPRFRSGVRADGRLRDHDSRGRLPGRWAARHSLCDRAGHGKFE